LPKTDKIAAFITREQKLLDNGAAQSASDPTAHTQ
jgi:hypothetical protein